MVKKYMDPNRQEYYDERAAIIEYDGKVKRELAERMAEMETVKKFGRDDYEAV